MDSYKSTFETWDKIASAYEAKFMDLDLYDDTYDLFCQLVEKCNPKIFEIGCGPGNITRYLLLKRPDFKIEAIDVARNMIKLAKINNPAADFRVMDCRDIEKLQNRFDAIMCGFCMPYLSKEACAKLINDSSFLLNHDGIFYFSVIEDAYHKSGFKTSSSGQYKMFVYYHEEEYLKKALKDNHFDIISLQRKEYTDAGGKCATHLIFIAKKIGEVSHYIQDEVAAIGKTCNYDH